MPRAKKSTETPLDALDGMLARLKLTGIREQIDNLLDEAATHRMLTPRTAMGQDGRLPVGDAMLDGARSPSVGHGSFVDRKLTPLVRAELAATVPITAGQGTKSLRSSPLKRALGPIGR